MGVRSWFRELMLGDASVGDDPPPPAALLNTILGRDEERVPSLGEYDSQTFPRELLVRLARREEVARDLLSLDVTDAAGRVAAIPQLHALLRRYPHPLVYETLIHACIDAGRYDEAKGVAFAARQRRAECLASEYPEIRAEVETLPEWEVSDIDAMRE